MSPPYESILIPSAAVSVSASLSVILTFILFEEMRAKFFMQIVAFISICDAIGNSPYLSLYRPPTGSWLCIVEGLINFTFYPMSWLWTLSLVYHLYIVAIKKTLPSKLSIRLTHVVCWGLPIILSLGGLPFTRFTDNESLGFEVCEVNLTKTAPIYHETVYYGLLLLVLLALTVLSYKTRKLEKTQEAGSFHPSYNILKDSTRLYPTAMVVCWLPHMITYSIYYDSENFHIYEIFYFIATVLKVIHGAITASIFFYKSDSARRLWRRWLDKIGCGCLPCCRNMDTSRRTMSSFGDGDHINPITTSLIEEKESFHNI